MRPAKAAGQNGLCLTRRGWSATVPEEVTLSTQWVRDSGGSVCGANRRSGALALKRCATDGRKCKSAPMARIRRCERRGRYLVIATLAPIYLGLVRRRLSRGRTHLRSSKLSTAGDTLNKSSRRCAPGSGASSGRWHLPSIEHTTTDDKCRAFLWSPMRAAPHPRDFVSVYRAGGELDHRDRE